MGPPPERPDGDDSMMTEQYSGGANIRKNNSKQQKFAETSTDRI